MSRFRASSIFVLLALAFGLAGACGQEPSSGNRGSGARRPGARIPAALPGGRRARPRTPRLSVINQYYLYRALAEQGEDYGARNYFFKNEDPGALIIVAGTGILKMAGNPQEARRFVDYLLAKQAQQSFADETYEYPMVEGVQTPRGLTPLSEIDHPDVDLGDLDDLQGTLELLRETGVL